MKPTFPRLSFIRVKKLKQYQVGEIVSLKTLDGKYHVHRITEINQTFVSTKGDNLEQQWYEINVSVQNIEGKVVWGFPVNNKSPKESAE